MLRASIKGLQNLERALRAFDAKSKKALSDAVKGTGYKLRPMLQKAVSSGSPGGRKFQGLSMLGKKTRYGGHDTPLKKMSKSVRYYVSSQTPIEVRVGWTGPLISNTWKKYAKRHQEGFESPVSDARRKWFRAYGKGLGKRSKYRKYFFLRKTTKKFVTPARPIIDPFWRTNKQWAFNNIRDFYRIKMSGGRF